MTKKSTKRALVSSIVSLLICFTMLLGTTFAWFTDSVVSGSNVITAGNLDIKVEYTLDGSTWKKLDGATDLFQKGLWEPGHTEVVVLKITNAGSLALKYSAQMNIADEDLGKTKDGKDIKLSDFLKVSTLMIENAGIDPLLGWDIAAMTLEKAFQNENGIGWGEPVAFNAGNILESDQDLDADKSHYVFIKVDMPETVGNEANHNGTDIPEINFGVNVLATQFTKEEDSFGKDYDKDSEYPDLGTIVTPENIATIDFTKENTTFVFKGTFGDVTINELGAESKISLSNATVGTLAINDDALLTGVGTLGAITASRDGADPITLTISGADYTLTGAVNAANKTGKSILNITDSRVKGTNIYVGSHVNNNRLALAELNVKNSYISLEENGLGSTISIDGRSGVKATIYDSEIYTYSRGWHQSEDANDNAITFQGATSLDVDIQRTNMHLYGARSIINVRQYGQEETTRNTNMKDCLIWAVTKSSHGDSTIPVWGFNDGTINDTILLFTKNVHKDTPAVFSSWVYGNPTIYGDYHVTTQCQWDAPIGLADGQTVTFDETANVSVYDGAGNVEFVKNGTAKVVVENGATIVNIGGVN